MIYDDDNPGAMLRPMFCDPNDPDLWERCDLPLTAAERKAQLDALDRLARELDLSEFVKRVNARRDGVLNLWRAAA